MGGSRIELVLLCSASFSVCRAGSFWEHPCYNALSEGWWTLAGNRHFKKGEYQ